MNLQQTFPPLRRSVWQPSADGFVCRVFDSDLTWQHSSEGLVCSVVFIQAFVTIDSFYLLGWRGAGGVCVWVVGYRLLTSPPITISHSSNTTDSDIQSQLVASPLSAASLGVIPHKDPEAKLVCQRLRRILAACLYKSFWTYRGESKLFMQSDI